MTSEFQTAEHDPASPAEALRQELALAREHQVATSNILRIISQSPSDVQPVFDAILSSAVRLLGGYSGAMTRVAGYRIELAALTNIDDAGDASLRAAFPQSLQSETAYAQAIRSCSPINIADAQTDSSSPERTREIARARGYRSWIIVPLLRQGNAAGTISVTRPEAGGFSDSEINLLQTFADQAVIAIENTRLFEAEQVSKQELQESLAYQTAVSEVLSVISRSPDQLQPVLDVITETAVRLCRATHGHVRLLREDGAYHIAAHQIPDAELLQLMRENPFRPGMDSVAGRVALYGRTVNVTDVSADPLVSGFQRRISAKVKTAMGVPLKQGDKVVGIISVWHTRIQPFTERQIKLVETFADQAVIAIENTRLFEAEQASKRELSEALEQQTATSEVLGVISSSPGELQPVFDAILANATRLCGASFGNLFLREGEVLRHVALFGAPAEFAELRQRNPVVRPAPNSILDRMTRTKQPEHIHDFRDEQTYLDRTLASIQLVEIAGARTVLGVPLISANTMIGAVAVYRRHVEAFTSKQVELVVSFAKQAVIAIENARLLSELRESLQQQTATADVLKSISRSTFDLQAVLDTLAGSAARLCDAEQAAIFRREGDAYRWLASSGHSSDVLARLREHMSAQQLLPGTSTAIGRAVLKGAPVQIADVCTDPDYELAEAQQLAQYRTVMGLPLMREGVPMGAMSLLRTEVRAFTDKQIELAQTFADQAVIAIENTRLFEAEQASKRELEESLEYQTATSDVLGVIAASPTNIQPVLLTLVESACRLCGAYDGIILLRDGDWLQVKAHHGPIPANPAKRKITRDWVNGRCVADGVQIHLRDLQAEGTEYPEGAALAQRLGARTILSTPLMRQREAIGAIMIRRDEVRQFSDKQIHLLETFADQAVVAIENARLFEAEQASKRELQESLHQQIATADVLKVISRATFDLPKVLDTLVESAARLCEADMALILRPIDAGYYVAAKYGYSPEYIEYHKTITFPPGRGSLTGRVLLEGMPVQIPDVLADPEYNIPESQRLGGYRTHLGVPLLRGGNQIGVILVSRRTVRPFDNKQIELVTTFADQAVIAIENTRLFEEVQARTRQLSLSLEQQIATSEVLQVISSSPTNVQPVFDAIVKRASSLCGGEHAIVTRYDGALLHLVAQHNPRPGAYEETASFYPQAPLPDGALSGRALLNRTVVHIPDIETERFEASVREAYRRIGLRAVLCVPMVYEDQPIGVVSVSRGTTGPFSDSQIDLLKTFSDQAVIAIENTRLFEEVQARTRELTESLEQQTATSEVLGIISSSPGVLDPVFDAMLANATRLCEAKFGIMWLYDQGGFRSVALHNAPSAFVEERQRHPVVHPPQDTGLARLVETQQAEQITDIKALRSYIERDPFVVASAELGGYRTVLNVPMLKDGDLVGAMSIYRQEVEPFAAKQIELVTNFARQAVIAIENARLLSELRESLQQQTATADVLKSISRSTFDLPAVLDALVDTAATLCDANDTAILQTENNVLRVVSHHGTIPSLARVGTAIVPLTAGAVVGRAVLERRIIQIPDLQAEKREYPEGSAIAARLGFHTILAVPLIAADQSIGVITLRRTDVRPFTDRQVELLQTFADQAVIAIENARLFEEVQARTRELAKTVDDLEVASQHKSQFVANMSHELRTPLAAILGYAELMQEGFYGTPSDKSMDALTRIRSNGKHLLGLINTVLDIAKIESGQFTLNMAEYDVLSIVETVRSATESLAQNKKLALKTDVAKKLPIGLGDEQRLTQVLLNLVGNAIKFTDTGEVRVSAVVANGTFAVSVADTGPGIPPDQLTRVFEQFHQVDSSNTKAKGGTGLGLSISKQIVEMHGGRIWVESTLGKGSVFHMELPTRAEFRKVAS